MMHLQTHQQSSGSPLLSGQLVRCRLVDVRIDTCFVVTMYLINLAGTSRIYSGYCF